MWSSRSASLTRRAIAPARPLAVADPEGLALEGLAVATGEQVERRALHLRQAALVQVVDVRVGLLEHVMKERDRACIVGNGGCHALDVVRHRRAVACQLAVVAASRDVSRDRLVHHWPPGLANPSLTRLGYTAGLICAATTRQTPPSRVHVRV